MDAAGDVTSGNLPIAHSHVPNLGMPRTALPVLQSLVNVLRAASPVLQSLVNVLGAASPVLQSLAHLCQQVSTAVPKRLSKVLR